jgi:hypothetical protein
VRDLTGAGLGLDAGRDVLCDPADLVAARLDLSGMQPRADVDT